jgi:hypothetical protein
MPTLPAGAYSQTFLATFPTQIYSPADPLVTGLITRMEHEEVQGIPTNVAWAGPAGTWPGESMNMAETYLLRNDPQHTTDMLVAALNHSYTTNVFKEEILTDVTKPRACDTPHSKHDNMEGTGDMPEAWGNANAVDLLRDMLVEERNPDGSNFGAGSLHLFAGLPASWLVVGQEFSVTNTPTTLGNTASVTLSYPDSKHLQVSVELKGLPSDVVVHLPVPVGRTIAQSTIDGKPATYTKAGNTLMFPIRNVQHRITLNIELR